MEQVVNVLSTHRGRDKFIRLTSYVSTFLAGQGKTAAGQRLLAVAKEMSGCRVVLRLFDDLPMLAYSLGYGMGAKEKNQTVRIIQILNNIANQLYFPIEHVAWLIDKKVIGFSSTSATWWVATVAIWAMSLLLEILKSLVLILQKRKESQRLRKESYLNAPDERETTEMGKDIKQQLRTLRIEHNECMLTMLQCLADLMNAINWLPKGFLWGGSFSGRTTGYFGIISTLIMLYRMWPTDKHQKVD
ncbi:hypothetical protein CHS0354_003426 [Potamilus streckersoni]|uniref:Peroxisomal membrane protein 11C n=1 Tax=Potamilus streckersoni TaxID=2493646 RepID=A0AAE0SNT7_9BIVA|nr:hypothetical protein CHS0354_003426 [Potamilus streckersoni]